MDGIWTFLVLTVLLSISPGLDDVLVLRSSLCGGPRLGMATVGGVAAGSLVWGIAAAVGLASVVTGSAMLYDVLLGAIPLCAELRRRARGAVVPRPVGPVGGPGGAWRAFSAGLMSDLLNPKIGLFYLAVVPQFVPAGAPALQYSLLLCAIDIGIAVSWLAGLCWLAHVAVSWLLRPGVVLWSQRLISTTLIGLGGSAAMAL